MRILLILSRPNYPREGACFEHIPQGLPYIAAVLKEAGHKVCGLNLNFDRQVNMAYSIKTAIEECQPEAIGLSGLSADFLFVKDAIQIIRRMKPDVPIILGGGLVSADTEFIFALLRPDVAVLNEGEATIVELIDCLESGGDLEDVRGIAYSKSGEIIHTLPRSLISNLDSLPFPEYGLFDIERHFSFTNQSDNYFHARTRIDPRILPISGARGCPYRCSFCWHSTGHKYRQRSIDSIITEIAFFLESYKPNIYKLYDEVFSVDENRVREFCRRVKEMGADFQCTGDIFLRLILAGFVIILGIDE